MTYLKQSSTSKPSRTSWSDPFNEPFDGGLDGKSGLDWERPT